MFSKLSIFVDELADCLNNIKKPPFWEQRFVAMRPSDRFLELDSPNLAHPIIVFNLHLCNSLGRGVGPAFGEFIVQAKDNSFRIEEIYTRGQVNGHREGVKGAGRELVRRSLLFAKKHGFRNVETSSFLHGAASFWIGLGFAMRKPVSLDWGALRGAPEAEIWAERIEEGERFALCDFAQTVLGRRALYHHADNEAFLNFDDAVRCRYVEQRLKLPLLSLSM